MRWSDTQLVRQLQANEHAAFEEVVKRHYQSVFRQLWHLCNDEETAADLTQETFAQAWKSLDSFEGKSTVRTWLYAIAMRVWYRWKNQSTHSLHHDAPLEAWAEILPDLALGPAQMLEKHSLNQDVQKALHHLPAIYRETLVLFYVQGLKYREIAETLEISLGTVKSRIHEGVKQLRAALLETLEGDFECEHKTLKTL